MNVLFCNTITDRYYEQRPDRVITKGDEMVVIDYKFGNHRNEYYEQVHRYIQLLQQMGHQKVTGYLWYVMRGEILSV